MSRKAKFKEWQQELMVMTTVILLFICLFLFFKI